MLLKLKCGHVFNMNAVVGFIPCRDSRIETAHCLTTDGKKHHIHESIDSIMECAREQGFTPESQVKLRAPVIGGDHSIG